MSPWTFEPAPGPLDPRDQLRVWTVARAVAATLARRLADRDPAEVREVLRACARGSLRPSPPGSEFWPPPGGDFHLEDWAPRGLYTLPELLRVALEPIAARDPATEAAILDLVERAGDAELPA